MPTGGKEERAYIRDEVKRWLAEFYGGLGCVLTGSPAMGASFHHLSGHRSSSEFPELVPLNLELHRGLRRKQSSSKKAELQPGVLTAAARKSFQSGHTAKAFGCARLAYALAVHFHERRNLETEFPLAAHALYFLRRAMSSAPINLVYSHLEYILEAEVKQTLDEIKLIPPFGALCLLIELGSWLNEFGYPREGLTLLRKARSRLHIYRRTATAMDVSRFQRQMAFAFLHLGEYGKEFEEAIQVSLESGDNSDNNLYCVDILKLNSELQRRRPKRALFILDQRFPKFEKDTDYCTGPLHTRPQTIQTSLVYIALSLICESHSKTPSRNFEERARVLRTQEIRYGVAPAMYLTISAEAKTAAYQPIDGLLLRKSLPILPNSRVNSILNIARLL